VWSTDERLSENGISLRFRAHLTQLMRAEKACTRHRGKKKKTPKIATDQLQNVLRGVECSLCPDYKTTRDANPGGTNGQKGPLGQSAWLTGQAHDGPQHHTQTFGPIARKCVKKKCRKLRSSRPVEGRNETSSQSLQGHSMPHMFVPDSSSHPIQVIQDGQLAVRMGSMQPGH